MTLEYWVNLQCAVWCVGVQCTVVNSAVDLFYWSAQQLILLLYWGCGLSIVCQSQGLEFATEVEYILNFVWRTICLNYIAGIFCHFSNDFRRGPRKLRLVICVGLCLDI